MVINTTGFPLAVGTVDQNPQNYDYPYLWEYYLTLVLIVLFCLLGFVAIVLAIRKKKEKYSLAHQIIHTFSYQESMKIFKYKENYLNIFNGVKALSMFWVILGHEFSVRLKYDVNIIGLGSEVEKFFFLFVTAGFLAVDVFFFIGGFLVAYSFLR
jgi:hypothetical protein